MEVLFSDLAPLRVAGSKSYGAKFVENLWLAREAIMVVAYVSEDAVVELGSLISRITGLFRFDLVIGMARFDGMTFGQMAAVKKLDSQLKNAGLGGVHVVKALPVHAKVSSFKTQTGHSAIVGSSNLSGLISSFRQFEVDVFVAESAEADLLYDFASGVRDRASVPLDAALEFVSLHQPGQAILSGVEGVEHNDSDVETEMTTTTFLIPLKDAPRSNLNTFFGAGRLQNGREVPRSWYEVELIVTNRITRSPGYPQAGTPDAIFTVITDDGWKFECSVQGDYSKNFRSKGDLKILGKWLKSRLQAANALKPGEPVTRETFDTYGRDNLTFTKLEGERRWYLDFSVSHD